MPPRARSRAVLAARSGGDTRPSRRRLVRLLDGEHQGRRWSRSRPRPVPPLSMAGPRRSSAELHHRAGRHASRRRTRRSGSVRPSRRQREWHDRHRRRHFDVLGVCDVGGRLRGPLEPRQPATSTVKQQPLRRRRLRGRRQFVGNAAAATPSAPATPSSDLLQGSCARACRRDPVLRRRVNDTITGNYFHNDTTGIAELRRRHHAAPSSTNNVFASSRTSYPHTLFGGDRTRRHRPTTPSPPPARSTSAQQAGAAAATIIEPQQRRPASTS